MCTVIFLLTWELNCYGRQTTTTDDDDRRHPLQLSYSMHDDNLFIGETSFR